MLRKYMYPVYGGCLTGERRMEREKPNPQGQREVILQMVYELVESFLPEDDKAMPPEVESRVDDIHRALSYALGLSADDDH